MIVPILSANTAPWRITWDTTRSSLRRLLLVSK